jgi:hypothetical protein
MTVVKYCKKMGLQDEYKEIMKLNEKSFYFYAADGQKLANYFSKMYQQSAKEILEQKITCLLAKCKQKSNDSSINNSFIKEEEKENGVLNNSFIKEEEKENVDNESINLSKINFNNPSVIEKITATKNKNNLESDNKNENKIGEINNNSKVFEGSF